MRLSAPRKQRSATNRCSAFDGCTKRDARSLNYSATRRDNALCRVLGGSPQNATLRVLIACG